MIRNIGFLLAGLFAAGGAQARPDEAGSMPYSIVRSVLVAGAPVSSTAPGTVRRIVPGDVIFEAPIVWRKMGRVHAPLTVRVAGLEFSVRTDQVLMSASASGGDLDRLPKGAQILCSHDYDGLRDRAKGETNRRARYQFWSVVCLVDTDADGRVDKAFTDGSKLAADWHMVDIAPTAYEVGEMVPHKDRGAIKVVYAKGLLFRPVGLQAQPYWYGTHDDFSWAKLSNLEGTGSTGRWPFKGPYPRRIEIGGAVISLLSFDQKTKVAEIRYESDFVPVPFALQSDRPSLPIVIY